MERLRCQGQADTHGLTLETLDASALGAGFRQRARKDRDVPFPHRNLVTLEIALSYAHERYCTRICLSINHDDTEDHAASTEAFIAAFRAMATTLDRKFEIATPLIALRKHEVVLLRSLGVDFLKTYTCLLGGEHHSGASAWPANAPSPSPPSLNQTASKKRYSLNDALLSSLPAIAFGPALRDSTK